MTADTYKRHPHTLPMAPPPLPPLAEATGQVTFEVVSQKTANPLMTGRTRHKAQMCLIAIAEFTETKAIMLRGGHPEFTGDRPDVEMAVYLSEMIVSAMDRAFATWRKSQQALGSGAKGTFQMAMAKRINERLRQPAPTPAPSELTSTALVVTAISELKLKAVAAHYRTKYPKLVKGWGFSYRNNNGNAFSAGSTAGNSVTFSRPVGSQRHAALA